MIVFLGRSASEDHKGNEGFLIRDWVVKDVQKGNEGFFDKGLGGKRRS